MADIRPLFPPAPPAAARRATPLALPQVDAGPAAPTPWTPKPEPAAELAPEPGVPAAELQTRLARLEDEARARGRAEGEAETAALRARLAATLVELDHVRAAMITPAADAIAEAATTVIGAWVGTVDREVLFAPIVRAWFAKTHERAIARVHPTEVDALRAAIASASAEAAIAIEPDPTLASGDLRIANATFELTHVWADRMAELRDAIAAAVARGEAP